MKCNQNALANDCSHKRYWEIEKEILVGEGGFYRGVCACVCVYYFIYFGDVGASRKDLEREIAKKQNHQPDNIETELDLDGSQNMINDFSEATNIGKQSKNTAKTKGKEERN